MVPSRSRTKTQLIVLPPRGLAVPGVFRNIDFNPSRRERLLAEMQRFRGGVYAADGAIQPSDLTADGRHKLSADEDSWHVLSLDAAGGVCACIRYLEETHAVGFDDLWVRQAVLAQCPSLGRKFRLAVEGEMGRARDIGVAFGEVGGWAVAPEHRWTVEPLRMILATYGLLELLGGCVGVATATFRHGSATILRRIGLQSLSLDGEPLPPYYDPHYGCPMEVLRFDSRFPSPKYHGWVQELGKSLADAVVIPAEARVAPQPGLWPMPDSPAANGNWYPRLAEGWEHAQLEV